MSQYSLFDLTTGEIVANISCLEIDADANTPAGHGRISGAWDPIAYYVVGTVVTLCAPMTPSVSGTTISNLPTLCTARIEGQLYEIDDGVLELEPDYPGPYTVYLTAVGYLPCEVTVS
jgi:hypothetical protein